MTDDYVSVRLSHLLRECSVGAIVRDGADSLLVVQDIRTWDRPGNDPKEREIRYVDRVRSALGIDKALRSPPRATERDGTTLGWIPALRFPTWMRCLQCGLLHPAPWRSPRGASSCWGGEGKSGECGGRLEQVPWVLVHEEGYLADVPWHDLAHTDTRDPRRRRCRADRTEPYLRLSDTPTGRLITCGRCQASREMRFGSLPRTAFPPGAWQQPWFREPPAQSPKEPAWVMEINDVRVHYPVTGTALVIPPESRIRRGTVLDRLYGSARNQDRIRSARNSLARMGAVRQVASEYRCTPQQIEDALAKIDDGYPLYDQRISAGDLMADEYRALSESIPDLREDEDFVTEHRTDEWRALRDALDADGVRRVASTVSRLVAVDKLKEVMVLKGFQRAGGRPTPPDLTGESDWLPALELYGEGIFFTLDEALLRRWEAGETVQQRAEAFARRYDHRNGQATPEGHVEVSPRFLLCHTLAHLVIRRLEAEAGYPAAALRERIYSGTGKAPMAGILIYVAVADEEGSLGGLMELAQPERFLRLLTAAFEAATWCSLDPVCAEQEGHGPDLLNRAACHACALVPEPSCSIGNVLLDRVFITGDAPGMTPITDYAEDA